MEQLSDVYSFHSITLPLLKRARQDRKIEVSCSEVDIQIEVKERENAVGTQKSRDVVLHRHGWTRSTVRGREETGEASQTQRTEEVIVSRKEVSKRVLICQRMGSPGKREKQ